MMQARKLDERLEYDFHEPLRRLGALAHPERLMQQLQGLLAGAGAPTHASGMSAARLAYLLSLAYLQQCRAEKSAEQAGGGWAPLATLFAHMQVWNSLSVCVLDLSACLLVSLLGCLLVSLFACLPVSLSA